MDVAGLVDLTEAELEIAKAYCVPRGIPLTVFRGRVVYPGEPEWLLDDIRAALKWQVEELRKCSGCGQPRSECMSDEDAAPEYDTEVLRCWACEAQGQELNNIRKAGDAAGSGLYVFTRKVG